MGKIECGFADRPERMPWQARDRLGERPPRAARPACESLPAPDVAPSRFTPLFAKAPDDLDLSLLNKVR